jgi:hypothetical protein
MSIRVMATIWTEAPSQREPFSFCSQFERAVFVSERSLIEFLERHRESAIAFAGGHR